MTAMSKAKSQTQPKPTPVLAKVISDLDREIARLTEARERLTTIEASHAEATALAERILKGDA